MMSLEPDWQSTIFGGYVFAGAMVGGISALFVVMFWLQQRHRLDVRVAGDHYHALGRLLLVFTAFWAYMAYLAGDADLDRRPPARGQVVHPALGQRTGSGSPGR